MKVIRQGHKYELENFENKTKSGQELQFIEKIPETEINERGYEENTGKLLTIADGTTNEEVLEVLIDRLNYLNSKFPCRENSIAITHLETSLLWLEKRTRDRIKRGVEGTNNR